MGKSFYLRTDGAVYAGSQLFATAISNDPGAYGLVQAQADDYAAANARYATAYLAAIAPMTRTRGAVMGKNAALANLRAVAAGLAKVIDGTASVPAARKVDLGLNVRAARPPIPPPDVAPEITIVERSGTLVRIRLHDGTGSRRGRPPGVAGASVFSRVSPTVSSKMADYGFVRNTTRTTVDVAFDPSLPPGTIVWICAYWHNPRGQSGPGCTPVGAILAGGGMMPIAA
jgi:hypothetical protein